jgi:hypothetical protein
MLKDNNKYAYSPQKTALSLHLVIFLLLLCSRLFDMSTTYLVTPNLSMESNVIVRFLGFGWFKFIVLNVLIIMIFFLLFLFSWKRYSNWKTVRYKFELYTKDQSEKRSRTRNIALEVGITLPIYVIITGYFQGLINLMIYMEWVLIRFTNLLFLYPLIVGGIFGSISLYLTKKILYSRNSDSSKKAHKVMVAKKDHEDDEDYNFLISSTDNSPKPWMSRSDRDRS